MDTEVQWEAESFVVKIPRREVLRQAAEEPLKNVRLGNATATDALILEKIVDELSYGWWESTPILSDELLDLYGDFYQNNDIPVPFIVFCKIPRYFGFN